MDSLLSLAKELLDDEFKNEQVNRTKPTDFEDKPEKKQKKSTNNAGEKYKRSHQKKINALDNADYECEFDKSHQIFMSRTTNKNYVEGHHLIPMNRQDNFQFSLDKEANIISLCPVCHKTIHHGKPKDYYIILEKLYKNRKNRLKLCKIEISLTQLKKYYKK